jgi:hypothetical protein
MQSVCVLYLATLLLATLGQSGGTEALERLDWLAGSWKLEAKGKLIEEHWTAAAGGMMIGMSRTVVNGKTVSFEFLRIEQRADGVVYIAQPEGKPGTEFWLAEATAAEWVFANPQHDFPNKIRYRRNSDGSLTARIEDETGKKGMDFPYQRGVLKRPLTY